MFYNIGESFSVLILSAFISSLQTQNWRWTQRALQILAWNVKNQNKCLFSCYAVHYFDVCEHSKKKKEKEDHLVG